MQEGVTAHADHFGPVPAEEGPRSEAYAGWVGDATKANGAAMALVSERPAEAEKTYREARD